MENLELGTCTKDINKKVLSQNSSCIKICGDMKDEICDKGCMATYVDIPGMFLIKNTIVDDNPLDAVVINDGKAITTLIYPYSRSKEELQQERDKLLSFGLSKSEVNIFLEVILGNKNKKIQDSFFISRSTLKTHLNNIYKKLPESYQKYKNRR